MIKFIIFTRKGFKVSKKVNKFYYSAITQHSNAGDALINRELIKLMRHEGHIHTFIGKSPKKFIEQIELRDTEILKINTSIFIFVFMMVDLIRGNEVFLVQTPGDISAKKNNIKDFIKTFIILIISILGIKVIQVGISLGEFSEKQKINYRIRSKFMHAIGLRDLISLDKAHEMKLKNFIYFPDLAFGINPILKNNNKIKKIGLSFRNDNLNLEKQNLLIQYLKNEFCQSGNDNLKVSIIVQVERDLIFAKRIATEVHCSDIDILEKYDLDELGGLYSHLDLVISNRLHVILLAALNGALSIPYIDNETNKKIIGLFENLGLQSNLEDQKKQIKVSNYIDNYSSLRVNFYNVAKQQNYKLGTTFKIIIEGKHLK